MEGAKNTITPLPWEEITTCLLLDFDEFIRSGDSRTINAQLLTHCFAATVGASPLGFRIPRRAISRRYCSCELFSPCWRFTLATSPDGLSPLSFSVGGILAGTKNSSLLFLFLGGLFDSFDVNSLRGLTSRSFFFVQTSFFV